MQAPRNWRSREQRYRLTGVQSTDGTMNLINRPQLPVTTVLVEEESETEITNANAA